jgi:hypothetical protein
LTEFDNDPFADVEVEAPVEPVKKAPAKKVATKPSSDREGVTVTLKGGAGFDAPWIVIHAADLADAYEQVSGDNAGVLVKLMEQTSKAAQHFSGQSKSSGAAPSNRAPAGATEAPAGTPAAPGPDWTYKTGVGKTGKPWKAWMPPRGSSEQPVWL